VFQAAELSALILIAATFYGSVGNAGASGYLAAMAFVGMSPGTMKPTALVLNILTATIVTARFYRAGHFSWSILWPFAVTSIPLSFAGGALHLPDRVFKPAIGIILFIAAVHLVRSVGKSTSAEKPHPPPLAWALLWGGIIGLLSGMTGTGGGIFLTPLLLFMGWADMRESSGVSAAFILVNSIAGFAGNVLSVHTISPWTGLWCIAAATGAFLGSELGIRRLAPSVLRYILAAILVVAGCKMCLA
jgi:hypothetical protein